MTEVELNEHIAQMRAETVQAINDVFKDGLQARRSSLVITQVVAYEVLGRSARPLLYPTASNWRERVELRGDLLEATTTMTYEQLQHMAVEAGKYCRKGIFVAGVPIEWPLKPLRGGGVNPPPAKPNPPKLSDCPVLKTKHWTEEDVRVAMDWCLERGLIEEPWLDPDGNLIRLPQHIRAALVRDFHPLDFAIRVVWEEDEDADWSWLEQPEFADDHVQLCARVQSKVVSVVAPLARYARGDLDRWDDQPVSLCGIDFLLTSNPGVGSMYADEIVHVREGDRALVGETWGDPYQLEVSLQLIDEFGVMDPEPLLRDVGETCSTCGQPLMEGDYGWFCPHGCDEPDTPERRLLDSAMRRLRRRQEGDE